MQVTYAQQVQEAEHPRQRAMHESAFEAGGDSPRLMTHHRQVVAPEHRGRGRKVISVDWTLGHLDRGPEIYGVKEACDYATCRLCLYQTVITAVIANREVIDRIALEVQALTLQSRNAITCKRQPSRVTRTWKRRRST